MDLELIYTNAKRVDMGILESVDMDLSFGEEENDFEFTVPMDTYEIEGGSYIYIVGTELGGIVDDVKKDTSTATVTYHGRTWHGILNSKVIEPDAGQSHYVVSGDANVVIANLIQRLGLGDLFEACSELSDIPITNYQFDRYTKAYVGIKKMLKKKFAKLKIIFNGEKVVLSAEPRVDYTQTDDISSSQFEFVINKVYKPVNHLICLGKGELTERTVIHLYADKNGNISRNQSLFGIDEREEIYENTNAEDDELLESGIDKLKEYLSQSSADVDFDNVEEIYDIGDIVGTVDDDIGVAISEEITQKIVKISKGLISVQCQIGSKASENAVIA